MEVLTLTLAMVLSLTIGLASARGALVLVMYLLEARHGIGNTSASVVRATGANPASSR